MATRVLPLRNDVDSFQYRIDLDGSTYQIRISWNVRAELWHIYVSDQDGVQLASHPLLINVDLWSRFKLDSLPPGTMFLIDPAGATNECGRYELGDRCKLVYEEAS